MKVRSHFPRLKLKITSLPSIKGTKLPVFLDPRTSYDFLVIHLSKLKCTYSVNTAATMNLKVLRHEYIVSFNFPLMFVNLIKEIKKKPKPDG